MLPEIITTKKIDTRKENLIVNGKSLSFHRVIGEAHTEIIRQLQDLSLDDHPQPRIPGPNPVSLERRDFPKLIEKLYVIGEKTDGIRFVLLFARIFGYKVCVMIDRAMSVYLVSLKNIPRVLFQGTIFDGELTVDKQGKTVFVLFDAVIVSGVTVSQLSLPDRIVAMKRSLKEFKTNPQDPVELRFKNWTLMANIQAVRNNLSIAEKTYHVDGLVMMAMNDPVIYGRNFDMFKLKQGQHYVDFVIMDNRGTIGVYDSKRRYNVAIGQVRELYPAKTIVECALENGAWRVIQTRPDKNQGNDFLTYEKTLLNIKENITVEEVLSLFNNVPLVQQ